MGWSIGFDEKWQRDIGYGVPAYCDHYGCRAEINRGRAITREQFIALKQLARR